MATFEVIRGLSNSGGGGGGYLVYTALLSQNVGGLTDVKLQNTLGVTGWEVNAVGDYKMTGVTFPDISKIWIGNSVLDWQNNTVFYPLSDGVTINGYYNFYIDGSGFLHLSVLNASFNSVELFSLIGSNNMLALPEIRVYQ